MTKPPSQEPKPAAPPEPKDPEINPMPEGPSRSDPVTAAKPAGSPAPARAKP